jgi:hypothetical protein
MVKQTLNRYPGPGKDRLASENIRVLRNDFLHGNMIAPAATLREPKLLPRMEWTAPANSIRGGPDRRLFSSLCRPTQNWPIARARLSIPRTMSLRFIMVLLKAIRGLRIARSDVSADLALRHYAFWRAERKSLEP